MVDQSTQEVEEDSLGSQVDQSLQAAEEDRSHVHSRAEGSSRDIGVEGDQEEEREIRHGSEVVLGTDQASRSSTNIRVSQKNNPMSQEQSLV